MARHGWMTLVLSLSMTAAWTATAAPESPDSRLIRVIEGMQKRGELTAPQARTLASAARDGAASPHLDFLSNNRHSGCRNGEIRAIKQWIRSQGFDTPPPPPPPSTGHLESSIRPLRVYYESEDQLGMAELVLKAAEDAWQKQVVEDGFMTPFTTRDVQVEPLPGLDIYIGDTGMGGGGYTEWLNDIPLTPQADCSAQVMIDAMNPEEFIAATVAHEFNHATQMATDCIEAVSAWENFATAVEHHYFPDDWATQYFVEVFQSYPEYPIDYWKNPSGESELGYYQYGASLFPTFLRERYAGGDVKFLRNIWYSFAQKGTVSCFFFGCTADQPNDPDWFTGLDNVLQANGSSFDDAFDEFSAWRAITGTWDDGFHFSEGGLWTEVATAATHYLKQGAAKGSFDVREYGSRYIELRTDGFTGPLHVQVNVDTAASWSASVLSWRKAEPVQRTSLSFTDGHGEAYLGSTQGVQRLLLVVSQHKDSLHLPDKMEYSTKRVFEYLIDDAPDPDGGAKSEPVPEAGPDARYDAKTDAKYDAEPMPAQIEESAEGGGCDCGVAGRGGRTPFAAGIAALVALAASVRLRRR